MKYLCLIFIDEKKYDAMQDQRPAMLLNDDHSILN